MAQNETQTAEAVASATPERPKAQDDAFPLERVIAEAGSLGLLQADLVGAYHGVPRTKKVTVAQVKERVRKWLAGEAATDDDRPEETA